MASMGGFGDNIDGMGIQVRCFSSTVASHWTVSQWLTG